MTDESLSEEDKALFRAAVGKVKPIKGLTKNNQKNIRQPAKTPNAPIKKNLETTTRFLSDFIVEEVSSDSILSYCQPGLPRKRMQDLIRGKIPWEARLDLHGFKADEASVKLAEFISYHYAIGTRSLLIIHGKGGHDKTPPILKNRVNRYLTQFEEVLAFHSALAKDGGLGAVYVLLKRQRD